MITQTEFGASIARTIAAQVRQHRKARGWSAQQLADECASLGMPTITRTLISDLENGRRETVNVAELLVLAAAIGLPPLLLLYPVGTEKTVEALPGQERVTFRAARWFSGEAPFPGEDDEDYLASIEGDWIDASGSPLGLYRANERALHDEAEALRRAAQMDAQAAVSAGPQADAFRASADALRQAAGMHRAGREGLRRKAAQAGLLPPRKQAGEA